MPKNATIWRPCLPIKGETPADYGKETWEDVYYGYDGYLEPEHPVRRYFDNPWTDECAEPWQKAIAVVEDLHALGAIDESTRDSILCHFCDIA